MAGGKQTPRQKMIGMMYLVLTALLALNVSKDILEAFVLVNQGISVTTKNFDGKNAYTYKHFQQAYENDPGKVGKFYDRAKKIRGEANKLYDFISTVKAEIISKTDKINLTKESVDTFNIKYIQAKDNQDVPALVMIGADSEDGSKGQARVLKNNINDFKKKIKDALSGIPGGDKVELGLDTKDPHSGGGHGNLTWETQYFEHVPLAAVITLLTKIQSDVRNAETNAIDHLYGQIDAATFKFDSLMARVIASSNYVVAGGDYQAEVFLSAYSTTLEPEIVVGGGKLPVEGGIGKYTARPNSPGVQKWGGNINVIGPDGKPVSYPFEAEYTVAPPIATISPTKMNVFYIGIENPVSISVPGFGSNQIRPSITQGTLTPDPKTPGGWIAKVPRPGEAVVTVDVENKEKKMQRMGQMKFRVKIVPDPIAKVADKASGTVTRSKLLAQTAVIPVLENFDFELYFQVVSFEMTVAQRGKDPLTIAVQGNQINDAMKEAIRNAKLGAKVYFESIRAKGPDGSIRSLGSVSLTLQ